SGTFFSAGERLVLVGSSLVSLRRLVSCSASAAAWSSPLAKRGAPSSLRRRSGTGMSGLSLSSPLLIDLQERHLPRTVPVVFGRRPRPLPELDSTRRGPTPRRLLSRLA